jgi:hypothetical protein
MRRLWADWAKRKGGEAWFSSRFIVELVAVAGNSLVMTSSIFKSGRGLPQSVFTNTVMGPERLCAGVLATPTSCACRRPRCFGRPCIVCLFFALHYLRKRSIAHSYVAVLVTLRCKNDLAVGVTWLELSTSIANVGPGIEAIGLHRPRKI